MPKFEFFPPQIRQKLPGHIKILSGEFLSYLRQEIISNLGIMNLQTPSNLYKLFFFRYTFSFNKLYLGEK
jgi:hypothetical protein